MSPLPITHPGLPTTDQGRRICQLIGLDRSKLPEYRAAHAAVWPGVLAALRRAHIFGPSLPLSPFLLDGRLCRSGEQGAADPRPEVEPRHPTTFSSLRSVE